MTASPSDLFWQSRDGLRLHARDHAPDPAGAQAGRLPVLCIPGLTRNATDFDAIASRIAKSGRRVLAVDLRGRAGSQHAANPRSYNAATYADDVLGLLRAEGIERAVFFGTSLGVLVTMTAAGRQADAVASAILNDAGPDVPRAALERIGGYAGKSLPPLTPAQAAAHAEAIGKAVYPHYTQADWNTMAARMFRVGDDGLLRPDYDPAIVRTARPWLLRLLRPWLWRAWRRLVAGRDVLLLRGAHSDVLEAATALRMTAMSPAARLVTVDGVGHAPDLSEPQSVEAIERFLAEVA